ncbi:MAG: hypothetical protein A3I02_10965 [Betaproteobacteria bacterium RIFCSPLOWO2_02_FULL_67_26]|nr:MAG: hypothetical protein A3I02_10965 [Betaproteobacteria bacterium RIFCSPLOWO2_02_FULL_67_26]
MIVHYSAEHRGIQLITLRYMNNFSSMMRSPSAAGHATRRRKRYAASLLVGWFAFWFTTAVAHSCENVMAKARTGQEPAALQHTIQGPAGTDQRETPCPSYTGVQPAPSALTVASFDSTPRIPGSPVYATVLVVANTDELEKHALGGRPPAPIPFHLRTARLLI